MIKVCNSPFTCLIRLFSMFIFQVTDPNCTSKKVVVGALVIGKSLWSRLPLHSSFLHDCSCCDLSSPWLPKVVMRCQMCWFWHGNHQQRGSRDTITLRWKRSKAKIRIINLGFTTMTMDFPAHLMIQCWQAGWASGGFLSSWRMADTSGVSAPLGLEGRWWNKRSVLNQTPLGLKHA